MIEANVDPNVVFMGERALSIAARQNRNQILKRLLDYPQTQKDVTSQTGGTILHFAAASKKSFEHFLFQTKSFICIRYG